MNELKELTIVRVFDADVATVWHAWTDGAEWTHWMHPRGVSLPQDTVSVDLRVGGRYAFTMVNDTTGDRYPTGGTYLDVVEGERLRYTWGDPDDPVDAAPVITLDFRAVGEQTEVSFRLEGITDELLAARVDSGWRSTFDVLDEYLRGR